MQHSILYYLVSTSSTPLRLRQGRRSNREGVGFTFYKGWHVFLHESTPVCFSLFGYQTLSLSLSLSEYLMQRALSLSLLQLPSNAPTPLHLLGHVTTTQSTTHIHAHAHTAILPVCCTFLPSLSVVVISSVFFPSWIFVLCNRFSRCFYCYYSFNFFVRTQNLHTGECKLNYF